MYMYCVNLLSFGDLCPLQAFLSVKQYYTNTLKQVGHRRKTALQCV